MEVSFAIFISYQIALMHVLRCVSMMDVILKQTSRTEGKNAAATVTNTGSHVSLEFINHFVLKMDATPMPATTIRVDSEVVSVLPTKGQL